MLITLLSGCASYTRSMIWENKLKPRTIQPAPGVVSEASLHQDRDYFVWLGHASVLLKLGPHWLLTDPVLGKRIGPPELLNNALGIKRQVALPISTAALPNIDVVLISHAHYDHLDLASLRQLDHLQQKVPTLVLPRDTQDLTQGLDWVTHELDWLQPDSATLSLGALSIRAFRVEHYGYIPWGKRRRWSGFNGYLISNGKKQILFFGDTAYQRYRNAYGQLLAHPSTVDWRAKFTSNELNKGFDLCLLPIGDSYFHHNHATPEEAVEIAKTLRCKKMLPIHYGTFILSPKQSSDDRTRMLRKLDSENLRDRVECQDMRGQIQFPEIGQQCRY